MPEDDQHNRGHKYPFLSAEIFNCEINQILDRFFEAPIKYLPSATASTVPTEGDNETEDDAEKTPGNDEKKENEDGDDEDKKDETETKKEDSEEPAPESKEDSKKKEDDVNPQAE
mmetsp:Transcript_32815/g.50109  ORF Transcript_32815/g.50109 Transcript_32815/m.50109 type:complete len:115 (-) Transcript_32815:2311-2655(-)